MLLTRKILPAIALAVALSPFAAQARSAGSAPQTQYRLAPIAGDQFNLNNQALGSDVTPGSATIDNPTVIYGGVTANSFRDSVGG